MKPKYESDVKALSNRDIAQIYCDIATKPDLLEDMKARTWVDLQQECYDRGGLSRLTHGIGLYGNDLKSYYFSEEDVSKIEDYYQAVFIGSFSPKAKDGGWINEPVDVFWQAKRKSPEHTHYFGMYQDYTGRLMICNGASCFAEPIDGYGVVQKLTSDTVYCSKYTHDFVTIPGINVSIDGGRSYGRFVGDRIGELQDYYVFPDGPDFFTLEKETE